MEKNKDINAEQVIKDINTMWRAGFSALCHCDDSAEGLFPDKCNCDRRKQTQEAISMLIEVKKKLIRKYQE